MNKFPAAKELQKDVNGGICCPNSSISTNFVKQEMLKFVSLQEKNCLEHSNQCLDICDSVFSQFTKMCFNILHYKDKQCDANYKFRNPLYSEHISIDIPNSISKLASKVGRTKRQTKQIVKDMELSIPVDFLIKIAEHFQITELVFVMDVMDLLGKYFG